MSEEVDPNRGPPERVEGCTCPNCSLHMVREAGDQWVSSLPILSIFKNSGDRVLVAKWPMQDYHRWDVVVFKYPKDPQQNWVPMNYIKRLIGLAGQHHRDHEWGLVRLRRRGLRPTEQPSCAIGSLVEHEYVYRCRIADAARSLSGWQVSHRAKAAGTNVNNAPAGL